MRIHSLNNDRIHEIPFLNAGKGQGGFYVDHLPVQIAEVDALPAGLDAIVVTADLQGRERFEEAGDGPPRLLGEVLPKRLADEILPDLQIDARRAGVVLAGDFYTVPALDQRGGSGNVTEVWKAFAREFAWVTGVAGNHDTFGEHLHPSQNISGNVHYLDRHCVTVDGLRIAGVGGIIGNPRRPHRRTDEEFGKCLQELLVEPADILVMHDGPNAFNPLRRGSTLIRLALERLQPRFVVRGHSHWDDPLANLAGGTQVLSVDARVVILRESQDRVGDNVIC